MINFKNIFLINCTVHLRSPGGYVIGWLGDFLNIPEMLRDCNEDPKFIDNFKEQLRRNRRPPFSIGKFLSSVMVAYFWAQVYQMAIPGFDYLDINWKFLYWGIPLAAALGK